MSALIFLFFLAGMEAFLLFIVYLLLPLPLFLGFVFGVAWITRLMWLHSPHARR